MSEYYKGWLGTLKRTIDDRDANTNEVLAFIAGLEAQLQTAQTDIARLRELVCLAHPQDCSCAICVAIRACEPETEPNAIICCICGKPINGADLDSRFWLHRIGCTDLECTCDFECHETCYDGHEHEYAPLDWDEEISH